jgi:hypothetical protein
VNTRAEGHCLTKWSIAGSRGSPIRPGVSQRVTTAGCVTGYKSGLSALRVLINGRWPAIKGA